MLFVEEDSRVVKGMHIPGVVPGPGEDSMQDMVVVEDTLGDIPVDMLEELVVDMAGQQVVVLFLATLDEVVVVLVL